MSQSKHFGSIRTADATVRVSLNLKVIFVLSVFSVVEDHRVARQLGYRSVRRTDRVAHEESLGPEGTEAFLW